MWSAAGSLLLSLALSRSLSLFLSVSLSLPVQRERHTTAGGYFGQYVNEFCQGWSRAYSSLKMRSLIVNHIYNVCAQLPCKYGSATYVITPNKPTTTTTIIYAYTHIKIYVCVCESAQNGVGGGGVVESLGDICLRFTNYNNNNKNNN